MTGKRHKGYGIVKKLIEGKQINSFREIFDYIPKSSVYRDLGINYDRFNRILKQIQGFKLEELYQLANLIDVDEKTLLDLAHSQYIMDKKKKRI